MLNPSLLISNAPIKLPITMETVEETSNKLMASMALPFGECSRA